MAEAVPLDPGSYQGTYKLIGGAPALDFANLVSYRGTDREHDWLVPASNAAAWVQAADLQVQAGGDVAEMRRLREVVARIFLALADGRTPPSDDIDTIGDLAATAWADRRLRFDDGAAAARWVDTAPSLISSVAINAAALVTSGETVRRIAACRECRWVFLDTTRNHSRAWCHPADCGNRARQRRHYQRRR